MQTDLFQFKPRRSRRLAHQRHHSDAFSDCGLRFERAPRLQFVADLNQFHLGLLGAVEQGDFGFGAVNFHRFAVVGDVDLDDVGLDYELKVGQLGFDNDTPMLRCVVVASGKRCAGG